MNRARGEASCRDEAFELKGRRTTLTVLRLMSPSAAALDAELAAKVARAPGLFDGLPVLLELDALTARPTNVRALMDWVEVIRRHGLVPIGIGAGHGFEEEARALGLSVVSELRGAVRESIRDESVSTAPAISVPEPSEEEAPEAPELPSEGPKNTPSRIVHQPIRSGQQIYAEGGDLIVMASVSPGAELLADGHIHVYGALRGRALAGLHGDRAARILCQRFDPELVSIAGWYKTSEELGKDEKHRTGPVQVYLEDEILRIVALET